MDPVQQLDDVALTLRRHRFHAPHLLEEKVISNQLGLPLRFHSPRSIQHQRHLLVLQQQSCAASALHHPGHLRLLDPLRLSDQI